MKYLYGEFSDNQIQSTTLLMHNEIHKLLLYKDNNFKDDIFKSDEEFYNYFSNLLYRYGGFNELLGKPNMMVNFMSVLQEAYHESLRDDFNYKKFRKLILDAHGYLTNMFKER